MILGLIQFLDNAISTAKQITLYQGRYFLSSVLVSLSTIIFCCIVVGINNTPTVYMVLFLALCSGLGRYLTCLVNDRFSKDSTYINIITCNYKEEIKELCDYLKENKVKNIMMKSYNQSNDKGLTLMIFAKTKHESRMIDSYLDDSKENFLREIIN